MKKLLFFSCFLMTSTIILVLFGNTNPISTIMAQGYNSDYNIDDSYSKYPTDDKKYECRTGPFEGFFVSSVEFCKFNKSEDSERDSKNGSQGPPGPQGPTGEQGPQGPTGPNQINPSLLYTEVGDRNFTSNDNPIQVATSEAFCDDGDVAIGGFYSLTSDKQIGDLSIIETGTNITVNSYFITIVTSSAGSNQAIQAHVNCFDNPPLR